MGQVYYSPISINAAQVPSTQTDFPVLVSQTDTRFKTTGNGGHVSNSNGYDIRPYSDVGLATPLYYELERYNASTGEVVMWVKVPTLSSSTTPIYLGYGDTGISSDGSNGPLTFSNNFVAVYHLKDGSTLSLTDSMNTYNGTNHGATAGAGKIDGCASFASASSQYVDLGTPLATTAALSMSAWVNGTTFPNAYNAVFGDNNALGQGNIIFVKSSGKLAVFIWGSNLATCSYDGTGTNTLSTSTWYHIFVTYSQPTGLKSYVNSASDATVGNTGTVLIQAVSNTYIANDPGFASRFFNGSIDEVRIASINRSADWITTEYNNQSAPGTFETLGTEVQFLGMSGLFRL